MHLDREKALKNFEDAIITSINKEENSDLQKEQLAQIMTILNSMLISEKWEERYGSLIGYKSLLQNLKSNTSIFENIHSNIANESRLESLLKEEEPRILEQLSALLRLYFFSLDQAKEYIKEDVNKCFELISKQQDELIQQTNELHPSEQLTHMGQTVNKDQLLKQNKINKAIEGILLVLKSIIEPVGIHYFDRKQIEKMIEFCSNHSNRHIRELIQQLILVVLSSVQKDKVESFDLIYYANFISQGMADNWSQVRFAASHSARKIYELASEDQKQSIDKLLLPRICFNRHYMAEGIKIYNQDTWKQVVGQEGKQYLAKLNEEVTEFYITQLKSENFQVREVATECLDEIFKNVASQQLNAYKPKLNRIVSNLLESIKDIQWQVRKGVAITLSEIFKIYDISDFEKEQLEAVQQLALKYLSENIPTVREACAILCGVIALKNQDFKAELLKYLQENLLKAKQQQPIKPFSNIPYGVKFDVDSKTQVEEQKQPALIIPNVATHLQGIEDPGFARQQELWELSDGSVYLLREIVKQLDQKELSKMLQNLPDLGFLDQFTESSLLKENYFKSLNEIIKSVGKKVFRPYLELFLDSAFRSAKDDRYNCQFPAQQFIMTLIKEYGEGIMKAVVESHDDRLLRDLDDIIQRDKFGHPSQRPAGFQQFPPGAGVFQHGLPKQY
eukprot:403349918